MNRPANMAKHPYYPPDLHIEAGYVPNTWDVPEILACFVGCIVVAVLGSLALARRATSNMTKTDQLTFCWFILCMYSLFFYPTLLLGGEKRVLGRNPDDDPHGEPRSVIVDLPRMERQQK